MWITFHFHFYRFQQISFIFVHIYCFANIRFKIPDVNFQTTYQELSVNIEISIYTQNSRPVQGAAAAHFIDALNYFQIIS